MKRILSSILALLLFLPPSFALAAAPIDISELPAADLLALWQAAGDRLRQLDAYPYIELSKGDAGADVTAVQQRLQSLYFYTADLTGKYDAATVKAVKAWEKAQGYKADGKLTIDEQDVLFSDTAAIKATPTPQPSPTPAPTLVPDQAALEITKVHFRTYYHTPVLSVEVFNHTSETIDTFTLVYKCYDSYGEQIKPVFSDGISTCEDQQCEIKPGKKYTMGNQFWYMFGSENGRTVEVAISKYHTKEGNSYSFETDDCVWYSDIRK